MHLRFTLLRDGTDVRRFDFDAPKVQIGADARAGDVLLLDLPAGLRHVRARIQARPRGVEIEVKGGPIWLQGSELQEGDVAELGLGDVLVFGTRGPGGPRLRFDAGGLDPVWIDDGGVLPAPPPERPAASAADRAVVFESEPQLNPWERARRAWTGLYLRWVAYRRRAARLRYWVDLARALVRKAGRTAAIAAAAVAAAVLWWKEHQGRAAAVLERDRALAVAERATRESRQSEAARQEIHEWMTQCGCRLDDAAPAPIAVVESILQRFPNDPTLNPAAATPMPDRSAESHASLIARHQHAFALDKSNLPRVMDRICSAASQKDRMELVVNEQLRWGLHEAYAFIPFVESQWCEVAVSPTGPRGLMQFTRATAEAAFASVDPTQLPIATYDFEAHRSWLEDYARDHGHRGLYGLFAACPATLVADYRRTFHPGPAAPSFPERIDPADARTDPYASIRAAMAFIDGLDERYAARGFGPLDRVLFSAWAYNQGEGEVEIMLRSAREQFDVRHEAALTFPMAYAAARRRLSESTDAEQRRRIEEGMDYGPRVVGAYLATAPLLDERRCR